MTTSRFLVLLALASTVTACKSESSGPQPAGPPAVIEVVSGDGQAALANTALPNPIKVVVKDANGTALPDIELSQTVLRGGGTVAESFATTDANGVATLPIWTLGKGAEQQTVRVFVSTIFKNIDASVQTGFRVEVRFWGDPMSPANQSLFTNAAARIGGMVIGDVEDALASGINLDSSCGVTGQPTMNETIDDVIIFASIQDIDGNGQILAQAGPCLIRDQDPPFPAVGVMEFDSADLDVLAGAGSLQDVITHEMLHVLGFGVLWEYEGLLTDAGGVAPQFTGENARVACAAVGGTSLCSSSVPVEGNTQPVGTRDAHWEESSFDTELMTGFIDATNQLSGITAGSLGDLGYQVNMLDVDSYQIPGTALRAGGSVMFRANWEHVRRPAWVLERSGGIRAVTPR